jgi:hypothetical protein
MATPITPIKNLMGIWKNAMEIIKDEIEDKENPEVTVRLRGTCRSCPKK